MEQKRRLKVLLTLPRSGTHFIWSRLVASGRYQLVYDADRIPALQVLSRYCDEKLKFLHPAPRSPNCNFQYNSLYEVDRPLTAAEHVAMLEERYGAKGGFELYQKIMSLQDSGDRHLFSINRCFFTNRYEFLFEKFKFTIEHAIESLRLYREWVLKTEENPAFALVIREVPDWVSAHFLLWGDREKEMILHRLADFPIIVRAVRDMGIPIFYMKDVIETMKGGELDFETHTKPLAHEEIEVACRAISDLLAGGVVFQKTTAPRVRWGRLFQYLAETDPIKRISLVRSVGTLPLNYFGYIPWLGRRMQEDYEGTALNNARIRPVRP